MKKLADGLALLTICFGLALAPPTAARAQEVYHCVLSSAAKASSSPAQDIEEIQSGCDGLLAEQDSTRLKKLAWSQCCQGADSFVKKSPIPSKGPERDTAAENSWAAYRVRLALATCDGIRDPHLNYQRNLCLTDMLFRILDPRVTDILNECSPVGHNVRGGKHRGGDPAHAPSAQDGASSHKPGGLNDLLLGDEAFSKCQHQKLEAFLRKIEKGSDSSPVRP